MIETFSKKRRAIVLSANVRIEVGRDNARGDAESSLEAWPKDTGLHPTRQDLLLSQKETAR
jgi:hypothetical protein